MTADAFDAARARVRAMQRRGRAAVAPPEATLPEPTPETPAPPSPVKTGRKPPTWRSSPVRVTNS